MSEEAVTFGEGKTLIGIVTDPSGATINRSGTGVILLNPGLVHRVGPGRIYVKIARALVAKGFVVLRFDFSGIGDSGVRIDNLPFEKSAVREACEAMDFLKKTRGISHFILVGGCSGAAVSLRTAGCDPQVRHAVLINFPVAEDEESDATPERLNRTKAHYYWNFALLDPKSWRKLITGKADYRQIIRVLEFQARRRLTAASRPAASETPFAASLRQLADRGVSLTFLCSQGDPVLDDLREAGGDQLKRLCALGTIALEIIPRSDHTFSSLYDQERLLKAIVERVETITSEKIESINVAQIAPDVHEVVCP